MKWTPNDKDKYGLKPVAACANAKNASTGMRFSQDETKICVMGSDGFANIIDTIQMKQCLRAKKLHNMVVTGCAFHPNTNTLVTVSTDYSYRFTSMNEFHFVKWAT